MGVGTVVLSDSTQPLELTVGGMARWHGTLVVEGEETGDGREFAPGSLEWEDPETGLILLQYQPESLPQHEKSVTIGRIDRIERDGSDILGWGYIDLGTPDGVDYARRLRNKTAGGVSVDVDSIKDADVELVFPDNDDESVEEDEDGLMFLFGPPPEKVVFHRGRIRAATAVALPAFHKARIELDDDGSADEVDPLYVLGDLETMAAIGTHDTSTEDGTWDAGANEKRLPSPMSTATARAAYAWMADGAEQDGEVRKTDLKFIHHVVDGDGNPGAASTVACSAGIGVLNGGRGGTTIPAADRQGVYNHLAAHLRDAGREPPALADLEDVLVAAAARNPSPLYPPMAWFQDPKLDGPTPWTIDDSGHVFGHLAVWSSCHITFPGRCVTPPRERDYPYFVRRELKTAEGEMVGVGPITFGTGHASLQIGAVPAAEHYDNTGLAAVDVAVGEDRYGIWVAGAIRPTLDELQIRELRGASLSGDWRRIANKLRLVAVLAVNVPGFPIPKMRVNAQADVEEWSAMVAAGIVTPERVDKVRTAMASRDHDGTIRVRRVR
jgi:hypothetical protein